MVTNALVNKPAAIETSRSARIMAASSSCFSPTLLAGKVAVVTGGATGIGFQIARAFVEHGAKVALLSRDGDRLRQACSALGDTTVALDVVCDIVDPDAVAAAVARVRAHFGGIDMLVNNAAANFPSTAAKLRPSALSLVMDVVVLGTFQMTKAVLPSLLERGGGAILNITVPEPERGLPGFSHAGAAKAAVCSLTASLAQEWAPHGIRVNGIGPGPVPTEGLTRHMFGYEGPDWRAPWQSAEARVPLGRLGKPEDIANAALFLCSPAAAWITGVNLIVDGGARLSPALGLPQP